VILSECRKNLTLEIELPWAKMEKKENCKQATGNIYIIYCTSISWWNLVELYFCLVFQTTTWTFSWIKVNFFLRRLLLVSNSALDPLFLTPWIKKLGNLCEKDFSILPRLLGKTSYTRFSPPNCFPLLK
jgi:hypothetical protein